MRVSSQETLCLVVGVLEFARLGIFLSHLQGLNRAVIVSFGGTKYILVLSNESGFSCKLPTKPHPIVDLSVL